MLFCPLGPGPKVNIYNGTILEAMHALAIIKFRFVRQLDSKYHSPARLEGWRMLREHWSVRDFDSFVETFFGKPVPRSSLGQIFWIGTLK